MVLGSGAGSKSYVKEAVPSCLIYPELKAAGLLTFL